MQSLTVEAGIESGAVKAPVPPRELFSSTRVGKRTVVQVGSVKIGAGQPVMMAGPCSVESYQQLLATAKAVKGAGALILRGGAYKPRTSPYDFQGLGVEALQMLRQVREETGLPIVSEVLSTDDIEIVAEHVDMLQVGARNMQNFALLRRLGQLRKPVLLKRSPAATVKEWLLAAEYLLAGGKRAGRVVRTGNPFLRPRAAQHPRPGRHGAGPPTEPFAGHCRSVTCDRKTRPDPRNVPCSAGRGCRRPDHRGTSRSRQRCV
jgi:3-deoxy-D-arabino-heptulosonate 7-phosphate (DAHP) synthase